MPTLSDLEKRALADLTVREFKYSKLMQQQLASALKSLYGEMTVIYNKWATNGKLTKAEMTSYNKYSTMEANIIKLLDPALKANVQTIKKLLPEQYEAAFFEYAWAVDNATGLRLSWGQVNTKANLAAFDITNPKNIEIANALKNYNLNAKKYIRDALLNGLTLGKSYPQMVKDLKNSIGKTTYEAMRIVRTEGQRALNKGQDDAYLRAIENGVEGKMVWTATLDLRTRPDHGKMDGVEKSADGYFHGAIGKAQYPLDPNLPANQSIHCRCHERFEIEGYSPLLRRTRADGVIPYQTYTDWKNGVEPGAKKAPPTLKITNPARVVLKNNATTEIQSSSKYVKLQKDLEASHPKIQGDFATLQLNDYLRTRVVKDKITSFYSANDVIHLGPGGMNPKVYMHEYGHAMDDKMGQAKAGIKKPWTESSEANEFRKAIRSEVGDLADRTISGDLADLGSIRGGGKVLDIPNNLPLLSDMTGHSIQKSHPEMTYWGGTHSPEYWQDSTNLPSEAFAHLFELFSREGPDAKDYMNAVERAFPNTLAAFKTAFNL